MDAALQGRIWMGLLCFRPARRCLAAVPRLDRKRGTVLARASTTTAGGGGAWQGLAMEAPAQARAAQPRVCPACIGCGWGRGGAAAAPKELHRHRP